MSTRRSRQFGNKYVKPEEIQNFIYDSDDEKDLIGEKESRNKIGVKTGVNKGGEIDCKSNALRIADSHEVDNQERESGGLNESLEKRHGNSKYSGIKLNNLGSKEEKNQKGKSVFDYLVSGSNIKKEENITTGLTGGGNVNKDISRHRKEESSEEEDLFVTVRKRTSQVDTLEVCTPKRFKVELDKEMSDAPAVNPLKMELALESIRRNEPIKRRNINTIMEELDEIGRRWKESCSRCKQSYQWGPPIVKNCSEKWDSRYLPQKIIDLYQKRLEGRYFPSSRITEIGYDRGDSQSEIVEARGVRIESDKVDEEGAEALDYEQCKKFSRQIEDDLNDAEGSSSMILRSSSSSGGVGSSSSSSNHGRNRPDPNEAGMSEQSSKEKTSKKSFKSNKDQKKSIESRQLVVQLEKCRDPHRQYKNEESMDSNKNFEENKGNHEDYGGSSQMNASKSHYEDNSSQGPMGMQEEDQVACPICQLTFEKHCIETHANQCATAAFQD